jgi:hypothetical protein
VLAEAEDRFIGLTVELPLSPAVIEGEVFYIHPGESSWEDYDDREVLCLLPTGPAGDGLLSRARWRCAPLPSSTPRAERRALGSAGTKARIAGRRASAAARRAADHLDRAPLRVVRAPEPKRTRTL